jgi:hypothetical protein
VVGVAAVAAVASYEHAYALLRAHHAQGRGRLYRRRPAETDPDLEPHRPQAATGGCNSNGDIPMLDFTWRSGKPSLRLLILHDDGQREFDYTSGAEQALERAIKSGWTIVSIKNDWATVF